jgi:endonuclease YncB( thermonuclease family)
MKYKNLFLGLMAVIVWLVVYVILPKTDLKTDKLIITKASPGYYFVSKVYDGDTIAVNMDGREEKVRMIGVDTPETHKPNSPVECYGQQASEYTTKMLAGKEVKLEPDPLNQNRDRYQRLLRYIYTKDGQLYNAELIRQGYGFAYLSFPFTKAEEFRQLQTKARANNAGLWAGDCTISDQNGRNKTNQL